MATESDSIKDRLTEYAIGLRFEDISPAALHATKARVIDTLGALIAGFDGKACQVSRDLAAIAARPDGATVVGTDMRVAPDMAAFANATMSRFVEANDIYRWPKSTGGHPSDVIMPILAAAEYSKANGKDFITSVVVAYEIYCRISDTMDAWGKGVEPANFARIGVAAATAKLWKLSRTQLSDAISMATVAGNMIREVRTGHLSSWKAVASGEGGRGGVYAAIMAKAGMDGPQMPFEGKQGWCTHITGQALKLAEMGGNGVQFKVETTLIKPRTTCAATISTALAAEKAALLVKGRLDGVKQVGVEVYESAKEGMGTGAHHWDPQSRETADHSIPYVAAAGLMDGAITPVQFDEAHLRNPALRALLAKVSVSANAHFTDRFKKHPAEHHARVTVTMNDGQVFVGESGADKGDLSSAATRPEIETKFRGLTERTMGAKRVSSILERLWNLESMTNVAEIPPSFLIAK